MKQRMIGVLASSGVALVIVSGCATTRPPPRELQSARAALQRAESGPAAHYDPAGLIEARQALDAAEHKYEDDQKSKDVETLAYVAQRDVEIAEAHSRSAMFAEKTSEREEAAYGRSERRAKVALGRLGLAAKEEPRGTVISLPSANMFAVDQATILPSARGPLVQITKAVKQVLAENAPQDVGRKIELVGYTDDTGTEEHNLDLSKRRADAVREFFAQHGLDAARMETDGKGEADPIADNGTAKGRAKNRRVEVVITPAGTGAEQ